MKLSIANLLRTPHDLLCDTILMGLIWIGKMLEQEGKPYLALNSL